MLKCSNPHCATNEDDAPRLFTVNVTVGDEYEVTEPIRKIPYEYFICVYCNSQAEGDE
jgi:aspartate carbamoyltransferase regulatory subunit